jgi:hypothetical protein
LERCIVQDAATRALTDRERKNLAAIAQSRTEGFDRVRRARRFLAYSALAQRIRTHCRAAGHVVLQSVSKDTVCKIVNARGLKPHRVSYYYVEQRDPKIERKMDKMLMVHKEVELLLKEAAILNANDNCC